MTTKEVRIDGDDFMLSHCINCGVKYVVPLTMWNHQRDNGGFHYCSNGHNQGWSDKSCTAYSLRLERDRLKQRIAQKDDEISAEQKRTAAYKGQVTKLKRRAKAGVCPCCNRHFTNLERHMASKHPDMNPEEPLKVIEGGMQ